MTSDELVERVADALCSAIDKAPGAMARAALVAVREAAGFGVIEAQLQADLLCRTRSDHNKTAALLRALAEVRADG